MVGTASSLKTEETAGKSTRKQHRCLAHQEQVTQTCQTDGRAPAAGNHRAGSSLSFCALMACYARLLRESYSGLAGWIDAVNMGVGSNCIWA